MSDVFEYRPKFVDIRVKPDADMPERERGREVGDVHAGAGQAAERDLARHHDLFRGGRVEAELTELVRSYQRSLTPTANEAHR